MSRPRAICPPAIFPPDGHDLSREMFGVFPDPAQEGRFDCAQAIEAEDLKTPGLGHALSVARRAARVQHRYVDPAEVEVVARAPDNGRDPGGGQVDILGPVRHRVRARRLGLLNRRVEASGRDQVVDEAPQRIAGLISRSSANITLVPHTPTTLPRRRMPSPA